MDIVGNDPDTQSAIDIIQSHVFFKPEGDHSWQSRPEFPTAAEMLQEKSDFDKLPKNPVDVPWASKMEYLTAQYEILRMEAVEGLRHSVQSFASRHRRDIPMDDDFTNVYSQVRVKEYVLTNIGPVARVSFSLRSKFRILWQQSKRLQPGSIVALSPKSDGFKKICKIATIAQRPYEDGLDQNPPVVDILWTDPNDAVIDPNMEFVMLESLFGYFESARHSLIGLQHAGKTDSPIDKYLTGSHTTDTVPTFVLDNPRMDLSSVAGKATEDDSEAVEELKTRDMVNDGEPPGLQDLTYMDESQLSGLYRVVSKELAIVQGPPGTGKTFTSVEALKVMVANRRKRRGPPIIVAAQTNHALDQILVHCINAGANVLRLGGRTQNELIKPRTLFELRNECGKNQIPADNKLARIDHDRRTNAGKIQELVDGLFSDRLLDPEMLLEFGIITKQQHDSLVDDSMESHEAMDVHGPFALWLGDSLIPARIREDRHPTVLEVTEAEVRRDLPEFECEKDEDLENIADDNEALFRLRGPRIQLEHTWSGKDPANLASWGRAVNRALQNDDLYNIDINLRGAVYQHFQARLLEVMSPKFTALIAENMELCQKRKAFKFLGNTQVVRKLRIDIVGCTTTGLTKYRGCLAAMQPESLLIEEAAETREANIVSALYPCIQQLVLVGDHKQLAPKCDIQRLGDPPHNINVSLFQRMVNLDMPYVMLKQQRRMKPELRHILNPFYPELYDHPSVRKINERPDVLGMGGRNLWLFDHTWPEDRDSDASKFNELEAEMLTNFFAYLVANGTPAHRITVLTFYKGQCKVLKRKLRRHPSIMGAVFNVCTVDSYQGEENDIILLSLVRSPQLDRSYAVGFLEDERRAVVAISRARRGFYVFGNVDNILNAHQASYHLWYKICSGFAEQGYIDRDRGLPLVCQPHNKQIWVKELEDWGDNAGGCDQACNKTRECGHKCVLKCHALPHEVLPCGEPCREKLVCGHGCQRLCGQKCFCDCKVFEAAAHQIQDERMSLGEQMMVMGAEETEMFKRNHRSALPQGPALPIPGQAGFTKSRESRPSPDQLPGDVAQWRALTENPDEHDRRLDEQSVALMAEKRKQPVSEPIIRETYRPTGLTNGQRVAVDKMPPAQESYNKVPVDNSKMPPTQGSYSRVAAAALSSKPPFSTIEAAFPNAKPSKNMANDTSTKPKQPNNVANGKVAQPGRPKFARNRYRPVPANNNHTSRKSPTKSGEKRDNGTLQELCASLLTPEAETQEYSVQQQPQGGQTASQSSSPVQAPRVQRNLATGGFLVDFATTEGRSFGGETSSQGVTERVATPSLLDIEPESTGMSLLEGHDGLVPGLSSMQLDNAVSPSTAGTAPAEMEPEKQGEEEEWLIQL
ncbi:P-loop containing nucleoside triphosphate hydrolase protein [Chaetomium sp. MPI-SDFR-AT-0129]|nr:P-loop containing nucleoside triphosphate hydrolase protein [Chaetomium sp. MPI-SDFR-AT-0129]